MAPRQKRHGAWLLLLLLLLAAGAGLSYYKTRDTHIRLPHMTLTGDDVQILHAEGSGASLRVGELIIGDRVFTHDSGADVMCSDGTHLHLGPLTDLLIEQDPNGNERLTLIMGAMRMETKADGMGMTVGVPYGIIHVKPNTLTVLDISVSQGTFVRVGDVSIEHGQTMTLVREGYQFTVDGLVLPINPNDATTLREIVFNLVKPTDGAHKSHNPLSLNLFPKTGTMFAPQTREYKTPQSPQALAQNDRVQTRAAGAYVVADTWGRYLLDEASELTVTHATQKKNKREAEVGIDLQQGGFTLMAPSRDNALLTTNVATGLRSVRLTPGLMLAQAHVKKREGGGSVKLRFGRLMVGDRRVEAGHVAVISEDDVREEPLSPGYVNITEDMTHVVHYPGQVPTINFIWSNQPTPPTNIEISRDTAFLDVPFAETIQGGSFMVDQLSGNRTWYWRAGGVDANAHQLQLQSETPDCTDCVPPDVISDVVPHTVIEFDETITRMAFEWRPFAGAGYYLFRVYNDGQFDKPLVVQHANQPNFLLLPPIHLDPGVYYWNAIAYDSEGRLMHKGNMSDFEIHAPEEAPPLIVQAPQEAAVVATSQVLTVGQTRPRAKVSCNGVTLPTDAGGRFSQKVPLHAGSNLLVYRVETNKRTRHVYVRQVTRP